MGPTDLMSEGEKAQVVALEMLRRAVADLPGAIARNALDSLERAGTDDARRLGGRGPSSAPADPGDVREDLGGPGWARRTAGRVGAVAGAVAAPVKNTAADMGGMLAAKFGAVLGPLAVFAQVLGSSTSGFSILGKAVQVLAATLGPILLPVVAVLGGALLELSDRLWDEIAPALENFYEFVVSALIPACEFMIDAFMGVVDVVGTLVEAVADAAGAIADAAAEMGDNAGEFFAEHAPGLADAAAELTGVEKPGGPAGGGPALAALVARLSGGGPGVERMDVAKGSGSGGGADFGWGGEDSTTDDPRDAERMAREAMRTGDASKAAAAPGGVAGKTLEFLREMRLTFMPKASIGGLGSVGNQAQLAAMNQSGFEAKMLERMDKAITTLEKVVAAAGGPPDRVFGDGRR